MSRVRALYDVHLICITHLPSSSSGVNPVHLILALFVLREPLRPGPRSPSILASYIRSYDFASPRIFAKRGRDRTVDGEEGEGEEADGGSAEEERARGREKEE